MQIVRLHEVLIGLVPILALRLRPQDLLSESPRPVQLDAQRG